MFKNLYRGWLVVRESILVFNRYPKFILPLLVVWIIYATIVLYLEYWFNWDAFTFSQVYLIIFGVIFIFAFLLSLSCSVLLELMQQLESGQQISFAEAFKITLTRNMIKILPIVLIWTVIWFILTVIQALLSKDKREKDSFSAENAAKTLANYNSISFSRAFFEALEKGVRMVVFLILPAIAWENMGFGIITACHHLKTIKVPPYTLPNTRPRRLHSPAGLWSHTASRHNFTKYFSNQVA
jgi:hypothetical protein